VYISNAHTIRWRGLLAAVLLLSMISSPLWAADQLQIWPSVTLAEQLVDNLPLSTTTTLVPQPLSPQQQNELNTINTIRRILGLPPLSAPLVLVPQQQTSGHSNDAISIINLGGSATVDSRDRNFSLDYSTAAEVYAQNSSLNQVFQDQYIGLHDYERLTPLTWLSLTDYFMNGQSTFGQSLIGSAAASPLLSQALLQQNFLTNAFNLQLNHHFGELLSTSFNVSQTYYSTSGGQTSQSFQQGGDLNAYYALYSTLRVGPDFQFYDFRFSNQPRSDSYQPSLGFTWQRSEHLVTSGTIGPLILSSPTGTSIGLGYTLSTFYKGKRWLLNLVSSRTPSITAGLSNASVYQYEGASAQYQLSRWTTAYINGSFSQFSQTNNNSYILIYGGGINYQVTRSIAIFGQYTRYQTNSPSFTSDNSPSLPSNATDTLTFGIRYTPRPWSWTF
jgi:opacity protein-like surface antigen